MRRAEPGGLEFRDFFEEQTDRERERERERKRERERLNEDPPLILHLWVFTLV